MPRGHLIRARKRRDGALVDKREVFIRHPLFGGLPPGDIDAMAKKWLGRPAGTLPE